MADSDKDIVITPNRSQTDQPTIEFTGQDATTIRLSALDTAALSFEGSEGQLLTITDDLSGDLFSVTDMSGIPAFTINSSANIGIGETAPLGQLHIKEEDSGQTSVGTVADQLVLEGGTYTGMTMLSTGQGIINFGDADAFNAGQIKYSHGSNALLFITNEAEKMRIYSASNGLVSIGTGSATNIGSSYGQLTINGSVGGLIQFTDNEVDKCRILSAADDLYTHITGDMIFRTGGFTSSDESVRIKADGKVGIGTDSPAELLHVSGGNTRLDGTVTIQGNEDSGDAFNSLSKLRIAEINGSAYIQIKTGNTSNSGLLLGDTDDDFVGGLIYYNNGNTLRFFAGNSERLQIDGTNSRIGFFNSSPTARFHFNLGTEVDNLEAFLVESTDTGNVSGPDMTLYRNSTSPANNDVLGTLWFYGNNDAATAEKIRYGAVQGVIEDVTDGAEKGRLAFLTGVGTLVAERMTIRSGGNVGIGTTSPYVKTEIVGGSSQASTNLLQLRSNFTATNTATGLKFVNSTSSSGTHGAVVLEAIRSNSDGDGELAISTSDAGTLGEVVRIDGDGRVGIGTDSPEAFLHIKSTGDAEFILEADSDNVNEDDNPAIRLYQDGRGLEGRIVLSQDNNFELRNMYSGGHLYLGAGGELRAAVRSDGKFGINDTSPSDTLHVVGQTDSTNITARFESGSTATSSYIHFMDSGTTAYAVRIGSVGNQLSLYSNSVERMRFERRRLGIGDFDSSKTIDAGIHLDGSTEEEATIIIDQNADYNDHPKLVFKNSTGTSVAADAGRREWRIDSSQVTDYQGAFEQVVAVAGTSSTYSTYTLSVDNTLTNALPTALSILIDGSSSNFSFTDSDSSKTQTTLVRYRIGSSIRGVLGVNNTDNLFFGTPSVQLKFHEDENYILPATGEGAAVDDTIGLGSSTNAFSNIYVNDVIMDGDTIKTKVCHLKTTTTAAIVEGSANEFTVDFDQEEHLDTSHFSHDSAGVVTVLKAGWYRITANLVYSNATGSARTTVRAFVKKNGTEITSTRTYDYDRGASYGKFSNNKIDTLLNLAANDTIEIANYAFNEDGNTSIQGDECEFIIMSMV